MTRKTTPLTLHKGNTSFVNSLGLGLCGLALIVSFHLYIFSLPAFSWGIWPQSETAVAVLNALTALCAFGLMLIHTQKKVVLCLFRHPLVLFPFLIGALSLLLLPFHEFPLRSVLGSVRTGEGTLWWLNVSVMSAAAMLLWRLEFWRRALIVMAVTGFAVSYVMTISYNYMGHMITPYFFSDYLAFTIITLMPLFYMWSIRFFKKPVALALFCVFFDVLIYFTYNKAIIVFSFVMPPLFFALWALPKISEQKKKQMAVFLIALLPIVAVIFMLVLAKLPFTHGFYDFAHSGFFKTIASRAYLVGVAIEPLQHNPLAWLTGLGWGLFEDHIITYLPLNWVSITNNTNFQWDGITTDHFHSHNMFTEILSALGISGFALLYLYFLNFALSARKAWLLPTLLLSTALVTWASLWFWLPLHLPYIAFAAASTSRSRFIKIQIPAVVFSVVLTGVILLQFAAAGLIFSTAYITHAYDPPGLAVAESQSACTIDYEDYGTGGLNLSRIMADRLRYTTTLADDDGLKKKRDEIQTHIKALNHLFCQSQDYMQRYKGSERLKLTQLLMRGEILLRLDEILDQQTHDYYYNGWKEDLQVWLVANPHRTDQAVPYLLWHVIHEQEARAQDIAEIIYHRNPNDPVGAWFKGLYMLSLGQNQQGLSLMRAALDNGIERVMVVEPEIKEMLKK